MTQATFKPFLRRESREVGKAEVPTFMATPGCGVGAGEGSTGKCVACGKDWGGGRSGTINAWVSNAMWGS